MRHTTAIIIITIALITPHLAAADGESINICCLPTDTVQHVGATVHGDMIATGNLVGACWGVKYTTPEGKVFSRKCSVQCGYRPGEVRLDYATWAPPERCAMSFTFDEPGKYVITLDGFFWDHFTAPLRLRDERSYVVR